MRTFKSSNPEDHNAHEEFDKLLSEIFPQEVPVKFVSAVKVIYKDGTERTVTQEELKGIVPKTGVVDHQKIADLWKNTKDVEMYINIEHLRETVLNNTKNFLKGFDKKD